LNCLEFILIFLQGLKNDFSIGRLVCEFQPFNYTIPWDGMCNCTIYG
jgi:hypothetical protein